ncbi:MAG: hypothetical protein GY898_10815 [Proteobacteria bacterium]|nr:hypothetical protein [Pseudomonadota bacterium]
MSETSAPAPSLLGRLAAVWGIIGVIWLLADAVHGVGMVAWEAIQGDPFTPLQWGFAALWVGFMAYSEGYRGFQSRLAPRVVVRAGVLARDPQPLRVLLAPAFVIGFFAGNRRRLLTSWGITIAIVGVVLVVRQFPQPWRGIIDFGVVVGLGWGIAAVAWFAVQALLGNPPDIDPQMPEAPDQ